MAFETGNNHGKGRPKGSANRTTEQIKELLFFVADALQENILNDIEQLQPTERVKLWLSIQEYIIPKMARLETKTDNDNEVRIIIENRMD